MVVQNLANPTTMANYLDKRKKKFKSTSRDTKVPGSRSKKIHKFYIPWPKFRNSLFCP